VDQQASVGATTGSIAWRRTTPYGDVRGAAPTAWPDQRGFVGGKLDTANRQPHEDARAAVEAAFGPQQTPEYGALPSQAPAFTGDMNPPVMPAMPPLPDFSTLPPPLPELTVPSPAPGALPPEKLEEMFGPAQPPVTPPSNDPGQFQIPGQ